MDAAGIIVIALSFGMLLFAIAAYPALMRTMRLATIPDKTILRQRPGHQHYYSGYHRSR